MAVVKDNGEQLHVVFVPYLSSGHIIPLVNAARLFAFRGVKVSILTTPHNALLFKPSVDADVTSSGHVISVVTVNFPSSEVGLPPGIESFSTATSSDMPPKIFHALFLLEKPMEDKIRELKPDCIFSDTYYPWTVDIAEDLKIPRILYNLSTCMCYSIMENLRKYGPHKDLVHDPGQAFVVPGLPDRVEMKVSQLTDDMRRPMDPSKYPFDAIIQKVRDAEARSFGMVNDTFYELEPEYADYFQSLKKPNLYVFGPITHFASTIRNSQGTAQAHDPRTAGVLEWLNDKKPKSVLYISFGSMARFSNAQLTEIAKALEASNVPFVWVLRSHQELNGWLPDGFEERTVKTQKGLLVQGWVQQPAILEHPGIGGFMTHAGTNSVLEAITAGVPQLTWPLYADQFYNEKQVEVLGLGVSLGVDMWNAGIEITSPEIGSERITVAINRLMCDTKETRSIRVKAEEMSKLAKNATKPGGSSWNNLTRLIDDIKNFGTNKA